MKFLSLFVLALATVSAFDLRNAELKQRNIVMPVMEIEGRITNGQKATDGQFPYHVGMDLEMNDVILGSCGGSIISEEYVLTAAHCLEKATRATIYFGTTNIKSIGKEVVVDKENFIIHEEFESVSLKNDIALIKISPAITYSEKIQPVKLPAISSSYPSYVGDEVIATGWGATVDFGDPIPDLQWATMKVLPGYKCQFYEEQFTSSNICVFGGRGITICNGDSGGPLVLAANNTQIGVTSFGASLGCGWQPDAFTRVTSYLSWISSKTGIEL